jgi:hypothetical protein
MAFTVDCKYNHGTHIVEASFDGVLVTEAEVQQLFTVLEDYVRPLRKPVYLVANFDSWRVETDVMRRYGSALRAFCVNSQTVFAVHSADIYARMNLRLAAVIGGASPNLFHTGQEALDFVQEQQRLAIATAAAAASVSPNLHY